MPRPAHQKHQPPPSPSLQACVAAPSSSQRPRTMLTSWRGRCRRSPGRAPCTETSRRASARWGATHGWGWACCWLVNRLCWAGAVLPRESACLPLCTPQTALRWQNCAPLRWVLPVLNGGQSHAMPNLRGRVEETTCTEPSNWHPHTTSLLHSFCGKLLAVWHAFLSN